MGAITNVDAVVSPAVSILPAADRTTTTTGSEVDLTGSEGAIVMFVFGTITDGTFTPSITSATASGGSFSTDTNFSGTMTAGTSAADETIVTVYYTGEKNFIKAVLTASGSPVTGGEFSAVVLPIPGGHHFRP